MKRLFDAPPEDVDESWTHGAVLGGDIGQDNFDLAKAYYSAARLTIEKALASGTAAASLVFPILFLFRHGTELYLKAIVRPTKATHDLSFLLQELRGVVKARHGEQLPDWIEKPVKELASFDPNSDAFRYEVPRRSTQLIKDTVWVSLRNIDRSFAMLEYGFRLIVAAEEIPLADIHLVVPRPVLTK